MDSGHSSSPDDATVASWSEVLAEDGVNRANEPCRVLTPMRQGTLDLPAHEQFGAWRDMNDGVVEYRAPAAIPVSYEASAALWPFGGLVLLAAETPAACYARSAAMLRRDGIDTWAFSMALHGRRIYRTREQTIEMRPGQLVLHSFAQPFEIARSRSGWLHLYLARHELPAAAVSGCQSLDTPGGRLLRDHLLLLARELPGMTVEQGQRMAEATRAMIALAVAPTPDHAAAAAVPSGTVQMTRLRSLMRAHLGSARLGPARLCQMTGISRSQLYRLFEPHGGVALAIQRERLNAAYRALSDPNDDRSVSEVAESVGLFDPSSFSRMFRRSFDVSPRELRMARSAGTLCSGLRPIVVRDRGSFADLLRAM